MQQVKFLARKSMVTEPSNLEMETDNNGEIGLHLHYFYVNVAANTILSESSFIMCPKEWKMGYTESVTLFIYNQGEV